MKIIEELIGALGVFVWMAFLTLIVGGFLAWLAVRVSGWFASGKK